MTVENDDILDPAHHDDGGIPAGDPKPGQVPAAGADGDPWEASDDGNIVTRGSVKYIRAEALSQARAENQRLSATLKQIEPLMPEFQEFITNKQNGRTATTQRAGAGADNDYTEDELDGYATTLGLYEQDGVTPDRKRAAQGLRIVDAIATRRSGAAVKPLQQQTAADRAAANAAAARRQMFTDGKPIAEERYVTAVLESLPQETLSDPTVSNLVGVIAAGLQALDERKTGRTQQRREPTFRDDGSGRFNGDTGEGRLSALDLAAARARGKTPEQWAKMIGGGNSAARQNSNSDILEDV